MKHNYPNGKPLTEKQQAILEFMEDYQLRNDNMPTSRCVQAKFKFASQTYANQSLHILNRKGYLEKLDDGSLGWRFAIGDRNA